MKRKDLIVDIPTVAGLERISHIPVTFDLASVILYEEAFTDFERSLVHANLDQDLQRLVTKGSIERKMAQSIADNPKLFVQNVL